MSDFLNTLLEATAAIKALQPEPQFVVVHSEDFPALKEQLESQGMEVAQLTGSSIWNCHNKYGGVILKVAVSEEVKQGKALRRLHKNNEQ